MFESAPRKVFWSDVRIAVEAMGTANAAIRPNLLDIPVENLYQTVIEAHTAVVEAILPQLPKAQPRQHWFNSHCMRLVDRPNDARQQGVSEEEIRMMTSEIRRECRRAKNEFLRTAVAKQDWVGIRKLKRFRAQQARIKDSYGNVQPSPQGSVYKP